MPPPLLPTRFNVTWAQHLAQLEVAALDLDDTLLTADKRIAPETMAALDDWLQAGKKVLLATGRPPRMVRDLPDLRHQFPFVCYNGCWIEDSGEVLYQNAIPAASVQHFVNAALDFAPHLWVGVEAEDMLYEPFKLRPERVSVVGDMRAICRPAMKIIFRKSMLDTEQWTHILDHLPAHCTMLVSELYDLIQIMPAGADKVEGIAWWLASQDLDLGRTVAIGDDTNDTKMVAAAHMGVAMQNAVPEVQEVADFITTTNDAGGVAQVLNTILATLAPAYARARPSP